MDEFVALHSIPTSSVRKHSKGIHKTRVLCENWLQIENLFEFIKTQMFDIHGETPYEISQEHSLASYDSTFQHAHTLPQT